MHDHHGHTHGKVGALGWALALTLGFAGIEALAGWWAGSLALLGDAGHMLSDSLSLGLAAAAALLAKRSPSALHSYGFGRAEILAALINALAMIAVVVWIGIEALARLNDPGPVKGGVVLVVAAFGLLINLAAAWLLSRDRHDLNVRAALLHVIGDLLGSVAALIAGVVILLTGWMPIDPLLSLLIAALILVSAVRVLREALHALMEGVPLHLDLAQIGRSASDVQGVVSVHDLHVWSLSSSRVALSAHVVVRDLADWPAILARLQQRLSDEFAIGHVTLQPEVNEQRIDAAVLRAPKRGDAGRS
jgi:cobalt-zinc-cadmium efflux system protein